MSEASGLLNHLSTSVLVLDAGLRVTYANPAAESFFEQSHNQLCGQSFNELVVQTSIETQRLFDTLEDRQSFSDSEVQMTLPDGRHRLTEVAVTCFQHNERSQLLLELKPIDSVRRISKENQQWAQQQAARELVRGIAHEVKNPLGGIRGAAQLLQMQLSDQGLEEYTGLIVEQSDRLRNLVDRLLGPNNPPQFDWHNLHQVLEKIRALLQVDDFDDISIVRDYDPSIPQLWIDEDKIQQAVLNIARNSAQALNGIGEIRFVTRIERNVVIHGKKAPLCARIRIIDNGPGIPDELRDTVFYPMVSGKSDGTGLGLSIAQHLIDHHKGKIDVESWPGHTEFSIYLPIDKKAPNS